MFDEGRSRREWAEETASDETLFADGFDAAIRGMASDGRVVYDIGAMVGMLVERDGMAEDEAMEFIDFNVIGANMGSMTPVYIDVCPDPVEAELGKV